MIEKKINPITPSQRQTFLLKKNNLTKTFKIKKLIKKVTLMYRIPGSEGLYPSPRVLSVKKFQKKIRKRKKK